MRLDRRATATTLLICTALAFGCRRAEDPEPPPASAKFREPLDASNGPQPIDDTRLHNAFRLHERVISGAQPDDQGFAALKQLGVQTIISVDGATPDVELAHQYGLRYVHLPFGYDGIPDQRVKELAKAIGQLPGPVYIHCHHGQHRSPAAAASACEAAGLIDHTAAMSLLSVAGTSPHYTGLFDAVERTHPLDRALLAELQVEYPETSPIAPLAEAMVAIEHTFDRLQRCAESQWRPPTDHPDVDPPHEALMLVDHLRELARTKDVQGRPEEFRRLLADAERRATGLERDLRKWDAAGPTDLPPAALDQSLGHVKADCSACHVRYRDVPQAD